MVATVGADDPEPRPGRAVVVAAGGPCYSASALRWGVV